MDKMDILSKLQLFLEQEKELQHEYAIAVAELQNKDHQEHVKMLLQYREYKGRVSAIKDAIEIVEDMQNKSLMKEGTQYESLC